MLQAAHARARGRAQHAVDRAGDVSGRTLLVNGCGPIGVLAVAAAVIRDELPTRVLLEMRAETSLPRFRSVLPQPTSPPPRRV